MQTAVHYYSLLNSLQYKRRSSLLEPVIGFVQAQKTFFDMGNETLSRKEFEDFVANISASVQRQVMLMLTFVLLSFLLLANVFCRLWYGRERESCVVGQNIEHVHSFGAGQAEYSRKLDLILDSKTPQFN